MSNIAAPAARHRLQLRSGELDVVVLPGKGADIYSVTDRASGIDVLFKSPWGWHALEGALPAGDSQVSWLARYEGGWQQLIPNAGAARLRDGVLRGYHGEAAVVGWHVTEQTESSARMTAQMLTAPLHLTRSLLLDGPVLHVQDRVRNSSPDPVEVMWVQHPAFGAPFIDGHCRLDFGAATLVSDADEPGTSLLRDTELDLHPARDLAGGEFDPRSVPAPGSGSSLFAVLTDFASGWFSIASPTAGFGIRLDWDATVFPHAWLWQECHATTGFPWFRRAYVIAIEPANVIPGDPSPRRADRGLTPVLPPGEEWVSNLSLSRTHLP